MRRHAVWWSILLVCLLCADLCTAEFKPLSSPSDPHDRATQHRPPQRISTAKQDNKNLRKQTLAQISKDRKRYESTHSIDIGQSGEQSSADRAVQLTVKPEYVTNTMKRKGLQKLDTLLQETRPSPLYSVTSNQFMSLIHDPPRPYWLFVSLTALSSMNQCAMCVQANDVLKPVAKAYAEQHTQRFNMSRNLYDTLDTYVNNDIPLFFLNVDVQRNGEVFKELKLQHAPVMVLLPPTVSDKSRKLASFLNNVPSKYKFNTMVGKFETRDFTQFIQRQTGITGVTVSASDDVQPSLLDAVIPLSVLTFIGVIVYMNWDQLLALRGYSGMSMIAQVAAWMFYMYCISGGMYNSIRGTIWAEYDAKTGSTQYINGDVRDQYASEGYLMGLAVVVAGFMVVLMDDKAFQTVSTGQLSGKQNVASLSATTALQSSKWYAPLLVLADSVFRPAVSGAIAVLAWYSVLAVYSIKNHGYNFGLLF